MNKLLLLLLCFNLTGCATIRQWQQEVREQNRICYNIQNAVVNKENLMGRSLQQIIEEFGQPNGVDTTYNAFGAVQDEYYAYLRSDNVKFEFQIMMGNGVVIAVHYMAPHDVPMPDTGPSQNVDQDPGPSYTETKKDMEQEREWESGVKENEKQADDAMENLKSQPLGGLR